MVTRPFVVNVRELLRHPGTQSHVVRTGPLPGVALPSAWVPDEDEVQADLTAEAQGGTVVVRGTARAAWVGECRRCLASTSGTVQVDIHEVFEEDAVEGETFPLVGEQVDLAPMLREAVTLGLPLAPLCDEACAGPDPGHHPVGSSETADGAESADDEGPPRDPRWAALDALRANGS
jgi:uncharacterized protein